MLNELTQEQRIARGNRAGQLLASDDFQAAIRDVDAFLTDIILRSSAPQADMREDAHAEYRALKRVVLKLRSWRDDAAKLAQDAGR